MIFMNYFDIGMAKDRYRNHPVLRKATQFLADLMDETNAHSDGWHSWPKPCRAARKLQELIQSGDATEAQFRAALSPIKSFYTRRGIAAGMQYPEVQ